MKLPLVSAHFHFPGALKKIKLTSLSRTIYNMGCADCFAGTIRLILFALNFVTLLAGGVVLGCGIFIKYTTTSEFSDVSDDLVVLDVVSYLLISVGVFVILISLMGCLGACLQNHVLLSCFFMMVLLLILSEIGIGVFFAIEKNEIEDKLDKAVENMVENYGEGGTGDQAIDALQQLLKCCGYNSPADYGFLNLAVNLPESCCAGTPTVCTIVNGYTSGCKSKIKEDLKSKSVIVIMAVASVAVLEFITMLMACYLRKRELENVIISEPPYSF